MEKDIKSVIKYFSIFEYPPNLEEIHTFFPKKASKTAVKRAILNLERHKKIKVIRSDKDEAGQPHRYTIGEYTIKRHLGSIYHRKNISLAKLGNLRFRAYVKLISMFPQVKLVGLSGSLSMLNAKDKDDVDLFIISSKGRLFTARFICLLASAFFGLRRKFGDRENHNKVCLNLFFDEKNVAVPKVKRSLFVAHEALQMKPLVSKGQTYVKFLAANKWVYGFFPNAKKTVHQSTPIKDNKTLTGNVIERVLKYMEMRLINSHRTKELVTDTQLWFHPDDFQTKINERL